MQKPIALMLSIILSLSVNSAIVFAASEPAGEPAVVTEASTELPIAPLISVSEVPVDVPVSSLQDRDSKAVQSLPDGTALISSPAETDSSTPGEPSVISPVTIPTELMSPEPDPIEVTVDGDTAFSIEASSSGEAQDIQDTSVIENAPDLQLIQSTQSTQSTQTAQSTGIQKTETIQNFQSIQSFDSFESIQSIQSVGSEAPFELKKTVVSKADGGFTVRLEAYAKAEISEMGQYSFSSYGLRSNQVNYESRDNLWFEYEPGTYAPVAVKKTNSPTPQNPASSSNPYFYENRYSLFERLGDGTYSEVQVINISKNRYRYIFHNLTYESNGNGNVNLPRAVYISLPLYIYTYSSNGIVNELARSTGANTMLGTAFFKRNQVTSPVNPYADSYIRDSLSEYFKPLGSDVSVIKLSTAAYIGDDSFGPKINYPAGTISISNAGKVLQIRGFDFVSNYVGQVQNPDGTSSWRGKKLIIEYPLDARTGFLGGNSVPVSGIDSRVYKDGELVKKFPDVTTRVAVPSITIQLKPINLYLSGSLTEVQLEQKAQVLVGDTPLDITQEDENYGLEYWQTHFIQIQKELSFAGNLSNLVVDKTYTLDISILAAGMNGVQSSATGKLLVFKPKLLFKDTEVWTGDEAPGDEMLLNNLISTEWIHENINSRDEGIVMYGNKPSPELQFEIPETSLEDGLIITKQDIPVFVTVTVGSWQEKLAEPAFMLKVRTCELTIKKASGKEGETYVYNISKNDAFYMTVSLSGNGSVTIHELATGTYQVEEEVAWSWRNHPGFSGTPRAKVKLTGSPTGSRATVTSVNSGIKNNKWLNDYSTTSKNARESATQAGLNPGWLESKKLEITG